MTIDTYVTDSSGKVTIDKDDKAVLDYTQDWTDWLAEVGDTISQFTITIKSDTETVPTLITAGTPANSTDGTKVVAWLKAGTIGVKYQVEYYIKTAAGREDERSIFVKIKDR